MSTAAAVICSRCAEPLREHSPDRLCGFCQEELANACDTCGDNPDPVYGCRCEAPGADKEGE